MGNNKDDKQAPKKGQAEKELELDGLKEAFDGEPSGIEGELGKKYVVDSSDEDRDNKHVGHKNKQSHKGKDEPEYKGPPDND